MHSSAPPGNVFLMSLKFFEVPDAKFPVIMFGGHDSKIHIMAADDLGAYQSVCKLSGHEDWVTTLDVLKEGKDSRLITLVYHVYNENL